MRKYKELEYKILHQGGAVSNDGYIISKNKELALIHIDFKSKYCDIFAIGSGNDNDCPTIYIAVGENTLHFDKRLKDELTEIEFSEFPGWDIICSQFSRYSLYVTLIKRGIW